MAINDNDKKFIKDTIDNALSNYEKKSDDKLKKYEENRKKLSKQEREDYIAILQKKNEQGEATLAQKFEMLKLSVENAVPEDLKDAFSSGKKAVKGGLNQAGRGLEHITGRIMETNPLTALLWQNRDLIKAGLDIGVGGIRAVGGVAKGAALGAAGLFNQALNMRKKQQAGETEETEDDINISKFSPVFGASKENPVAEILEQKQDWQKQIDDIHKILIKQNKEQNVSNKTLSEGLGGLGKTMTTVKGFVDLIQSKQKLILAGVLVGVAALVGLAMWFQKGGLGDLFNKLNPMNKTISDSFANKATSQESSYKLDATGSALSGFTGAQQQQFFNKKPNLLSGISKTTTTTQHALDANGQAINLTQMKFNTGNLTPVLAPYHGSVSKLNKQTNMSQGKEINTQWVMIIVPKNTDEFPVLKLLNITSPQVRPGNSFKKGDIIGYATNGFSMENYYGFENNKMDSLKDYQSFVNEAKQNNYTDNLQRLSETKTQEETDKLTDFRYKKSRASYYNKENSGTKWANIGERTHDFFHSKNEDIDYTRFSAEDTEGRNSFLRQYNALNNAPVATTVTPVSDNSQKAQQQTQTLKQQEVAADEKYNKEAQQALIEPQSQTQSTISVDGDKTAYVFSDVQLSQAQYGAMTGNLMNLNIA